MNNSWPQLLLYSLSQKTTSDVQKRFTDAINEGLDLNLFFAEAKNHGLLPLVYSALSSSCRELIPNETTTDIKKSVRTIGMSNLGKVSVLIQLMTLLDQHNISAVPFKGPLLACTIYNNLSLRSFCDLDVLIDIYDVIFTYNILCKAGYQPEIEFTESQLKSLIRTEDNLNFIHTQSGVIVELHWELSGRCLPHALTLSLFIPRLIDVEILNHTFRSLGNEDLVIYLCIHGSKHIWMRLEWLFSVHELIRLHKDLDWDLIFNLAEQLSAKRMLGVGVLAGNILFKTVLPSEVNTKLRLDHQAMKMAESVAYMFMNPNQNTTSLGNNSRFSSWQLQCMDSNWGKFRFVMTMLFSPTIEDYRRFSFPGGLTYLYYLFRPFRLGWEGIKKAIF